MRMRKKLLSALTALAMIVSPFSLVFAEESVDDQEGSKQSVAVTLNFYLTTNQEASYEDAFFNVGSPIPKTALPNGDLFRYELFAEEEREPAESIVLSKSDYQDMAGMTKAYRSVNLYGDTAYTIKATQLQEIPGYMYVKDSLPPLENLTNKQHFSLYQIYREASSPPDGEDEGPSKGDVRITVDTFGPDAEVLPTNFMFQLTKDGSPVAGFESGVSVKPPAISGGKPSADLSELEPGKYVLTLDTAAAAVAGYQLAVSNAVAPDSNKAGHTASFQVHKGKTTDIRYTLNYTKDAEAKASITIEKSLQVPSEDLIPQDGFTFRIVRDEDKSRQNLNLPRSAFEEIGEGVYRAEGTVAEFPYGAYKIYEEPIRARPGYVYYAMNPDAPVASGSAVKSGNLGGQGDKAVIGGVYREVKPGEAEYGHVRILHRYHVDGAPSYTEGAPEELFPKNGEEVELAAHYHTDHDGNAHRFWYAELAKAPAGSAGMPDTDATEKAGRKLTFAQDVPEESRALIEAYAAEAEGMTNEKRVEAILEINSDLKKASSAEKALLQSYLYLLKQNDGAPNPYKIGFADSRHAAPDGAFTDGRFVFEAGNSYTVVLHYDRTTEGGTPPPIVPPTPPARDDTPPSGGTNESTPSGDTPRLNPRTRIPDEAVPLAEIPDEEVPLANTPDLVKIIDEDVPLGNLPQTGGSRKGSAAAFLLLCAGGLLECLRRGKDRP